MGKKIGAVFLFLTAISGITVLVRPNNGEQDKVVIVLIIAGLVFAGIKLWMSSSKSKNNEADNFTQQSEKRKVNEEKKYKRNHFFFGKHMAGLPVAQGASCNVFFDHDCVKIDVAGNEFTIQKSKVSDVAIKTDVEIQNAYVSSVGGAVGGAVLFGPLGAIVGGRAKKKQSKTYDYYFIITYKKDNDVAYVSFKVATAFTGSQIVREFQTYQQQNGKQRIEL